MRDAQTPRSGRAPASRAEDVIAFGLAREARAMQALRDVFGAFESQPRPLPGDAMAELRSALAALVQRSARGGRLDAATLTAPSEFSAQFAQPVKVAELAIMTGRAAGLSEGALVDLALAASLMNLGYAALRRRLVSEPGLLDDRVWQQEVKQHPLLTAEMLGQSRLSPAVIAAIEQHHERCDGSGYPAELAGADICLSAQLLGVADAFVSLCLGSSTRQALAPARAAAVIAGRAGTLFDRQAVTWFMHALDTGEDTPDDWVLNPDERDEVMRTLRRISSDRPLPFSRPAAPRPPEPAAAAPPLRSANALTPELLEPDVLVPAYLAPSPVLPAAAAAPSRAPQSVPRAAPYRRPPLARRRRRRHGGSLWSTERYLEARSYGGWARAVAPDLRLSSH